ncbi:MAG: hypothetical protein [Circular genetic element sp.]|nr:MAG: hypothetical protein [Circular genetic element sp.]
MSRSKNLHFITKTVSITMPEDPVGLDWADGVLQVDELLSQQLGITVRNGNSFRLVGYGAQLNGTHEGDQDLGFAGTTLLSYVPVTRHSVAAHQNVYKQWMKQKKLSNRVGQLVRYDDFELGWDATHRLSGDRKSELKYSGIGDSVSEELTLYGNAIAGDFVSIQDVYNSLNPIEAASEDAYGVVIKEPKFAFKFPSYNNLVAPTTFSAGVDPSFTPDAYESQIATGSMYFLPADNHLSHLTGTLRYRFRGVSPDTLSQIGDTLSLIITLVYEGWAPLNSKTRTKSSKKKA